MVYVYAYRACCCVMFAVMALWLAGCSTGSGGGSAANSVHGESAVLDRQVTDILGREPDKGGADVIRFGDKLIIDVWMRDRVSQLEGFPLDLEMPESGMIFIPHVGNFAVASYTPDHLQDYLQGVFSKILYDSTVIVRRSRGEAIGSGRLVGSVRGAMSIDDAAEHIVMMGSVIRPGIYSLGAGLHLREALALAGGLEARRSGSRIFIVRGSNDAPEVLQVRVDDLLYGKNLELSNVALQHKDAIYIPVSRLWRTADFVATLLSPIISVREAIWVYDRFR